MKTYGITEAYLKKCRATKVYRKENGGVQIYYHSTCVVETYPDKIILRSGGWRSATTKLRMNQASNCWNLKFHIYQKDHVWYVTYPGQPDQVFFDGYVINRQEQNNG